MHPLDPFVTKAQKGLKDDVYDAIRDVYAAEDRLNVLTEMLSIELSPLTVSALETEMVVVLNGLCDRLSAWRENLDAHDGTAE